MIDRDAEERSIRARIERWLGFVKAGDLAGIVQIYAPDARLLFPSAPVLEGHDAIRRFWQDLLQKENVSLHVEPTRIEVAAAGDMAYELGTYALAFGAPDQAVEDRGKYLIVWQKRDGEWTVVADSPNSDVAPSL